MKIALLNVSAVVAPDLHGRYHRARGPQGECHQRTFTQSGPSSLTPGAGRCPRLLQRRTVDAMRFETWIIVAGLLALTACSSTSPHRPPGPTLMTLHVEGMMKVEGIT